MITCHGHRAHRPARQTPAAPRQAWHGHIIRGHPELAELRGLAEAAVTSPLAIHLSRMGAEGRLYFGPGPRSETIILVVADLSLGVVKTAHLSKRFSGGPREWPS